MSALTTQEASEQPFIGWAQARSLGLKHFFEGTPCKHGHLSKRYVSDRACVECKTLTATNLSSNARERRRELDRKRYAAEPDKFKARAKQYREKDPEHYAAIRQAQKDRNPGYTRTWYAENADEQRGKRRDRQARNPELYRALGRNRYARKKNAEGFHTAEDMAEIRQMQRDKCAYCRTALKGGGHGDHIVPLARGGSNWPSNMQFLCETCNTSKGARDPLEFCQSRGMLL